jgi:hypothetical protein
MVWQISKRHRFVELPKSRNLVLLALFVALQPCLADDSNLQSQRQKQELKSSLALIRAQQGSAVQKLADDQRRALAAREYQQATLERLHEQNQATLSQMRQARTTYVDQYGTEQTVPTYSQGYILNTSRRMDLQEQQYANEANFQGHLAQDALHRSGVLDTESDNLKSQLESDQVSHGFKLSPVGTNLYVRNYQLGGSDADDDQTYRYSPQSGPPKPLVAQPGSLLAGKSKASSPLTVRSAGKSGRVVQTTVTGQYIKP